MYLVRNDEIVRWESVSEPDGKRRTGFDVSSVRRIEEFSLVTGEVRVWFYRSDGLIAHFVETDDTGVPRLERDYDELGRLIEARGFYQNSALCFRVLYDSNEQECRRWSWNQNGVLVEDRETRNSYRHGWLIRFSERTGRILSREQFEDDQRHGLTELFQETPDGVSIKERSTYSRGAVEGAFQKFYPSGSVEEQGCIRNGKRDGVYLKCYPNGQLKSRMEFADGHLHGVHEEYFENGKPRRRSPYRKGKSHGVEEFFNEKGQLTSRSCHVDGTFSEDFSLFSSQSDSSETIETFYPSGSVSTRYSYSRGVRHGPFASFFPNGKEQETGNYKNGKRDGEFREYANDGKIVVEENFQDNRLQGIRTERFESGAVRLSELYSEGILVTRSRYYENGKQASVQDWRSGLIQEFSDRGHLILDGMFVTNLAHTREYIHGRLRVYSDSGQLLQTLHFANGELSGECVEHHSNGSAKWRRVFESDRLVSAEQFLPSGAKVRDLRYMSDGSTASDVSYDEPTKTMLSTELGAAATDRDPFFVGARIDEFEILRSLGQGGMGRVFLAKDTKLDRLVAIKTLQHGVDEESLRRFNLEGLALSKISHPNVVAVYGTGQCTQSVPASGPNIGSLAYSLPYLVMEFVEGWPLSALIAQGLLGVFEQVDIFRQMVEGIRAAHHLGILHRDLKPNNIVVGKDLSVKVIDFGISKILNLPASQETQVGIVMGTPRYLAPEVAMGYPASIQTDIYGLGLIFLEMFTGLSPFKGKTDLETLEHIKTRRLEIPIDVGALLPPELNQLVNRMIEKRLADRTDSLDRVAEGLNAILSGGFQHLPAEFQTRVLPSLRIDNLDSLKTVLRGHGLSPGEASLVINLAVRLQLALDTIQLDDATVTTGDSESFVIKDEILDRARLKIEAAKRGLIDQ